MSHWILPAGDIIPGSEVLWEGVSKDETWEPMKHESHGMGTNVWGIDSFTRKNIDIVLREVDPRERRLTKEERPLFVTRILLPALNAQEDDISYDIRHALRGLRGKYETICKKETEMQKGSSSITKSKKYISVRSKRKKVFGVKDISNVKILYIYLALIKGYNIL